MMSRKLPYLGVLPSLLVVVALPVVTSCGDDSSSDNSASLADAATADGAVASTTAELATTTPTVPDTDEHPTGHRDAAVESDAAETSEDVTSSTPTTGPTPETTDSTDASTPVETTSETTDAATPVDTTSVETTVDATVTPSPSDGGADEASTTASGEDTSDPCLARAPDNARGVFVSPDGSDVEDCGLAEAPCQTISLGIAHALGSDKDTVYIARGTYAEQLTLYAPISLFGGYTVEAGVWNSACSGLADTTLVNSPNAIGLLADFSGIAQVRGLTISTKDRDDANGESRYGVFAHGGNTRLTFADVAVRARDANHGHVGDIGETLASAICDAGYGENGAAAEPAAPTTPGAFSEDGFVPGTGASGNPGNLGQGGSVGSPASYNCASCSMQPVCLYGGGYGCYQYGEACVIGGYAYQTAQGGANGCGGAPGSGGAGGGGGGSSVGIFAWQAKVSLNADVVVLTSDGGDGAQGGQGGQGAAGTAGAAGQVVQCNAGLGCSSAPCTDQFQGGTGGTGGSGSNGSSGGVGAGGWSVALAGTPGAFTGANKALTLTGEGGGSPGDGFAGLSEAIYVIQ